MSTGESGAAKKKKFIVTGGPMSKGDSGAAKKKKFIVTVGIEIEIDECLLEDVLTDHWRAHYYALMTPEQVAEHLALNLVQGSELSSLDGFADQPGDRVRLVEVFADDCEEM